MAKKVIRIDDLDGNPIDEYGDVGATLVGLHGVWFEIDLRASNLKKLEELLEPYTEAGRKPEVEDKPVKRRQASSTGPSADSGLPKEQLAQVREWAQATGWVGENGKGVGDKGRVAQAAIDAWEAAHSRKPAESAAPVDEPADEPAPAKAAPAKRAAAKKADEPASA